MSSVRTGMVIVGLALFSGGCFALFSLDDYGPVDDPLLSSDGGDGDVIVATDVVVVDGPPNQPLLAGRIVFVTSTTSEGNFGGAAEADKTCQDLAAAAKLNGSFKAWVSDTQSTPRNRFSRLGAYPDGGGESLVTPDRKTLISPSFTDLAQNGPRSPIAMTEKKELLPAPSIAEITCQPGATPEAEVVWTATAQDGDRAGMDCNKWQVSMAGIEAQVGAVVAPDSGKQDNSRRIMWTAACALPCNGKARFYCFEQ